MLSVFILQAGLTWCRCKPSKKVICHMFGHISSHRVRTKTLLRTGTLNTWPAPQTMAGTDTPFGPYKVISKRCEEDGLLHNAKLLSQIDYLTHWLTDWLIDLGSRCPFLGAPGTCSVEGSLWTRSRSGCWSGTGYLLEEELGAHGNV